MKLTWNKFGMKATEKPFPEAYSPMLYIRRDLRTSQYRDGRPETEFIARDSMAEFTTDVPVILAEYKLVRLIKVTYPAKVEEIKDETCT